MFVDKVTEAKRKKIRVYPAYTNRASELGHECLRYLVLSRVAWDQASPYDVSLQYIFDEGHHQETAVLKDFMEAGRFVLPLLPLPFPLFYRARS